MSTSGGGGGGARSNGKELEEEVVRRVWQAAHAPLTRASTEFERLIHGCEIWAWADIPAWALVEIGWMSCHEGEQRRIYEGPPSGIGFCEYGADWLALKKCANGKWYAVLGQTKDHKQLKVECLGRFFVVGAYVRAFNIAQGWPPAEYPAMALCYPQDTHVSAGDLKHLQRLQHDWGIVCVHADDFERSPRGAAEAAPAPEPPPAPMPADAVPLEPWSSLRARRRRAAAPAPAPAASASASAPPATPAELEAAALAELEAAARPRGGKPRQYQTTAVTRICKAPGLHLVKGPPGCGKTHIMATAMGNLLHAHSRSTRAHGVTDKPAVVFFVAPYKDLVKQFCNKSERVFKRQLGADWKDAKVVKVYQHTKDKVIKPKALVERLDGGARVFLATEASAHLLEPLVKRAMARGHPVVVMKDEAHYNASADVESVRLLQMVRRPAPDAPGATGAPAAWPHRGVVCTATPTRAIRDMCEADNPPALNMSLEEAIALKVCRPYEILLPLITAGEQLAKDGLPTNMQTLTTKKLRSGELLGAAVLFTVMELLNTGARRCIVYTHNQKEAQDAHDLLQEACALFEVACDSEVIIESTQDRDAKYWAFRTNPTSTHDGTTQQIRLQFLVSCQILDFGIDLPGCDSISILRPPAGGTEEQSANRAIQRTGRAMRKGYGTARIMLFTDLSNPWLHAFSQVMRGFDPAFHTRVRVSSLNPVKKYTAETKALERASLESIIEKYDMVGTRADSRSQGVTPLDERQAAQAEAFFAYAQPQIDAMDPARRSTNASDYLGKAGSGVHIDYTLRGETRSMQPIAHWYHVRTHWHQVPMRDALRARYRALPFWTEPDAIKRTNSKPLSARERMQELCQFYETQMRCPKRLESKHIKRNDLPEPERRETSLAIFLSERMKEGSDDANTRRDKFIRNVGQRKFDAWLAFHKKNVNAKRFHPDELAALLPILRADDGGASDEEEEEDEEDEDDAPSPATVPAEPPRKRARTNPLFAADDSDVYSDDED